MGDRCRIMDHFRCASERLSRQQEEWIRVHQQWNWIAHVHVVQPKVGYLYIYIIIENKFDCELKDG